ncbi:isopenicillin N synthase family dioxygenase [Ilumatobacter coccineus]|uniref:Putative oxidoreductase n=1 Tax=Ilumatobacter coccineus (strain NBRC 103263 / KCTC 29153 / YM16-304) TaxID=1313172 RepID=A0A6C7ECH9_ILUCY|nr:2-oxoglutarate and iron-dependent oxygenase domain-containing protein [Ilumatobacter coccineus]BAN04023.1 putative oxidoreductase [Ilumatobacter coccineus YM16-304]
MTPTSFESIPIVSLSDLAGDDRQRGALAERLCTICHEIGFVVVTDHGIDASLIDDVFELMQRFFALDDDHKRLIDKLASPHFRGWEAVGSEFTNNRVDVREQIDLWTEWPAVDDATDGPTHLRLLGPNQWMPDDVLPGQRDLTLRWMRDLGDLADRILELLAIGLGLEPNHFADLFGEQPMSLTKMIHYPPTPAGGAGVNAHHDTGFLTLLQPGPTAGLQVLNPRDEWIDVPTVPGAFVVNLGEMLQAMTGNYFVATAHRVITTTERLSAAYFHGPSLDTELTPIELPGRFTDAVAASERHRRAGFMASSEQTDAGVGDMASELSASTYGEQLWNYFCRSYPANVAAHYPD